MKISLFIKVPLLAVLALFVFTRLYSVWIEHKYPPVGKFAQLDGVKLHYVDIPAATNADLPVMIFNNGASGNLHDQKLAFEKALKGRGRMIFVDRPGHGYSTVTGENHHDPVAQGDAIAKLLEKLAIAKAIIIGHSFGGAVAAAFAVNHPEKTAGLIFLAPASHRWPGGVEWYYHVAATPVLGTVFTELIALPAGLIRLTSGTASVFAPNGVPQNYIRDSRIELVLRPHEFRANARDVVALKQNVTRISKSYNQIKAPTIIITGDSDDIVLAHIHSKGLEKDISGARLIELENVGHKPDYVATNVVIKAIENISRQIQKGLK